MEIVSNTFKNGKRLKLQYCGTVLSQNDFN